MTLTNSKLQNALASFFHSASFILIYSAFVVVFSFLNCNGVVFSVILLTLALIFFTQKDLKPVFVPLTLSYFAFRFIEATFVFEWYFYVSLAIFACSLAFYIAVNKPSFRPTANLKAIIPYAAAYVVAGSFAANYLTDKLYFEQLGMLVLLFFALVFFFMLGANSTLSGEFVYRLLFAMGSIIALQCFITAMTADNFIDDVFMKDNFYLNWGIYSGIITVVLFSVPACFYLAVKHAKFAALFVLAAFLQTVAGCMTASRAAIAALIPYLIVCFAVTVAVVAKQERKTLWFSLLGCVGIAIAGGVALSVIYDGFLEKLLEMIKITGGIDLGRDQVWSESIQYFLENPLFGLGMLHHHGVVQGNASASLIWMSHNTYYQALSSLGIVGFAGLTIHTIYKYKSFAKSTYFCLYGMIILIGTELYGLIDCLMPSPYYLLPLILMLIGTDRIPPEENDLLPLKNRRPKENK